MINYSIIIPHYNIPDLLIRCVRSIPVRDDVEIIVVDDNSPEGENYPDLYPDLKRNGLTYIHLNKNIGGGGARNVGLKHAKGKWLIFADADDFFNYCFNDALDEYIDCESDVIYFKANSIDTTTYVNTRRSEGRNSQIEAYINNPNISDCNLSLRYRTGEPWCKIVRHDLVFDHKIDFEETPINNDTQFAYLIGFYARNISADRRAIYCLTDRDNSVSRTLNEQLNLVRLEVYSKKIKFLKDNNIPIELNQILIPIIRGFYESEIKESLRKAECILEKYNIDKDAIMRCILQEIKKDRHNEFKKRVMRVLKGFIPYWCRRPF